MPVVVLQASSDVGVDVSLSLQLLLGSSLRIQEGVSIGGFKAAFSNKASYYTAGSILNPTRPPLQLPFLQVYRAIMRMRVHVQELQG